MNQLLLFLGHFLLCFSIFIYYYKEGMIFLQENDEMDKNKNNNIGGVKEHKYFNKLYHFILPIATSIIALVFFNYGKYQVFDTFDFGIFTYWVLSLVFLGNQVAELSYVYSRYNVWFSWNAPLSKRQERIQIFDLYTFVIEENYLKPLYFFRTFMGVIFLLNVLILM